MRNQPNAVLYIEIIYNLSLLVALSVLSGFIGQKQHWPMRTKSILQGLVFGSIATIGMLSPLVLSPGVIFDGRSVVVSLCALFFGPLAGLIAAAMAVAMRVWIGGLGILTGTSVIAASAVLGMVFHWRIVAREQPITNTHLLTLGMSVHLAMFALMFTFPHDTALEVIRNVGLPILTVYPIATIIIGRIIYDNLEKGKYTARLAASEEKYRRIAENMSDVIWTVDRDGRVTFVSPSVETVLGKPVARCLRETIDEQFPPDSARRVRAAIADEIARDHDPSVDRKRSRYAELEIYRADGTTTWVSLSASILRGRDGEAIGFQGVMRDISALRNAAAQLLAAKEKAEESDRLKTAFLMNMSHEIRTPMNGILGFISLLSEPDLGEENRKEYLDIVNLSGARLLSTINDIIEISRIEAGQIEVIREEVDVNEVLRQQISFFTPMAAAKGVALRRSKQDDDGEARILTDRYKLEASLGNLINNAIKFTQQGSVEIRHFMENGSIHFSVRDTGCGIPHDRREAIFERFVQVDMKMNRSHEGSGLGLPIVKAYLDVLGGGITVESEPGVGSTFHFWLPVG
ncbi:MAG: ATP-binding protein [Bacteroidota bacterium]|jgi:PAS domain S-box-containing protein|nr:ATP-binding protein [Bacteroidota bacterium]